MHTTDDRSIDGLLVATMPDWLVLRSARLLDDHHTELGGEIRIPRDKVLFVQYPPAGLVPTPTRNGDAVAFALP